MNEKYIEQLIAMAEEAKKDNPALACILYTVTGTMRFENEELLWQLAHLTTAFSKEVILQMQSANN